jgi:hypothetical protein
MAFLITLDKNTKLWYNQAYDKETVYLLANIKGGILKNKPRPNSRKNKIEGTYEKSL